MVQIVGIMVIVMAQSASAIVGIGHALESVKVRDESNEQCFGIFASSAVRLTASHLSDQPRISPMLGVVWDRALDSPITEARTTSKISKSNMCLMKMCKMSQSNMCVMKMCKEMSKKSTIEEGEGQMCEHEDSASANEMGKQICARDDGRDWQYGQEDGEDGRYGRDGKDGQYGRDGKDEQKKNFREEEVVVIETRKAAPPAPRSWRRKNAGLVYDPPDVTFPGLSRQGTVKSFGLLTGVLVF